NHCRHGAALSRRAADAVDVHDSLRIFEQPDVCMGKGERVDADVPVQHRQEVNLKCCGWRGQERFRPERGVIVDAEAADLDPYAPTRAGRDLLNMDVSFEGAAGELEDSALA